MLHRLCGPPSIPLSFILANVLPRWVTYHFRLATQSEDRTASDHRLRRGLPGYLILFAPHAFVPQRQYIVSRSAFAIGILCNIYAFHRYTTYSNYFTIIQDQPVSMAILQLSCRISPLT